MTLRPWVTNSFPTLILGLTKLVYSCWESTPSSLDTRSPSWKTETKSSLKPDCYKSAAFYPWMYLQVCVRSLKLNNVRHKWRVSGRMANSASWEILRFKLKIPMEKTMETSSSYRMKLEWNIQVFIVFWRHTTSLCYPSFEHVTHLSTIRLSLLFTTSLLELHSSHVHDGGSDLVHVLFLFLGETKDVESLL